MVDNDMNLNYLYAKVKAIHFGTNRFFTYNFLCCQ